MAFMLPALTSCENDDFDTQQYKGGVSLNVWGPSPVMRGGELRFLGSGMDQINSISIPGTSDITDIRVISSEEIRITVPQDAEPGKLVLHHAGGDITTLTMLSYTEPIVIESMLPSPVKPGATLTIKGDYLNLISRVLSRMTKASLTRRTIPAASMSTRPTSSARSVTSCRSLCPPRPSRACSSSATEPSLYLT